MPTPLPPAPDDKDWTFVLDRPCPECGFVAAEIDVGDLAGLVGIATAPWAAVLSRPDAAARPAPQV